MAFSFVPRITVGAAGAMKRSGGMNALAFSHVFVGEKANR